MNNKIKKIVLAIFIFVIFPKNILALTATTSCSVSSSTVSLGNTVTVRINVNSDKPSYWNSTIKYDDQKLQYISGNKVIDTIDIKDSSSSFSYTFKTFAVGTATISTGSVVASDGNEEKQANISSCTINIINPSTSSSSSNSSSSSKSSSSSSKKSNTSSSSTSNINKNSDNNLKSLSIDGASLSPEFNKDTLEYNVEFPSDTTKIKINGEVNDKTAKVDGIGEKEVVTGLNKIDVVVTAENGSTRTYIINVVVKEKDPINVKVNKKKLTLMRTISGLEIPEGFEKTSIQVDGEEIEAYRNESIGYVIVGLLDSKGNAGWYKFDENKLSFSKYTEVLGNNLKLIILDKVDKKDFPYKYKKCIFYIGDEEVNGYVLGIDSKFRLVYALNTETNESGFYLYDMDQNTFQRFYNEQVLTYIELIKKCKIGLVIIGGVFAILFITVLALMIANHKIKKKIKNFTFKNDNKKEKMIKEKTILDE